MLNATNRDAAHRDLDAKSDRERPLLLLLVVEPEPLLDEEVGTGVAMGVVGL